MELTDTVQDRNE